MCIESQLTTYNSYTSISNSTVNTINDPMALAIWVYLITKPINWTVRRDQIMAHFGIGKDRYHSAIKILKDLGLYETKQYKDSAGKFKTATTIVRSECTKNEQFDPVPCPEKPDSGKTGHLRSNIKILYGQMPKDGIKTDTKKDDKEVVSYFERFWKEYPRKVKKQDAMRSFCKLGMNSDLFDQIIAGLRRYKNSDLWKDAKYIPHPTTFLNGKRWEDELAVNDYKNMSLSEITEKYGEQVAENERNRRQTARQNGGRS